jgi:hypothetical protein
MKSSEEILIDIKTRTSAVSSVFAGWTRERVNTLWKRVWNHEIVFFQEEQPEILRRW